MALGVYPYQKNFNKHYENNSEKTWKTIESSFVF